ncbi:hypothetical protein E4U14_000774 [Claviceps sp. LM454 group G7]|nr:hypothetical protein E4U14_000774 [Claviceps sp. LM454 group G7]
MVVGEDGKLTILEDEANDDDECGDSSYVISLYKDQRSQSFDRLSSITIGNAASKAVSNTRIRTCRIARLWTPGVPSGLNKISASTWAVGFEVYGLRSTN